MKKTLFTLAFALVAFTGNAQSNLKGDMNDDGEKNITDVMLLVDEILNGSKPQAYLTCPDDHHPHLIDLGLPSGTKWACCNVGTTTPEGYGGYYAWGETETKSYYDYSTYQYYKNDSYQSIGDDIAGTQYDVAHVKWGGPWVMPSKEQNKELVENCTFKSTTVNGVNGGKYTSMSNGGSIFLPAAGYRRDSDLVGAGSYGSYWSSTQSPSTAHDAYYLFFSSGGAGWYYTYGRYLGQSVRPVSRN